MVNKVVYKKGDIVYVDCTPQAGHEQSGRRPALIISNEVFNAKSGGLMMVCPITNTIKSHPLHVSLPDNGKTTGVVLADQARTMDVYARNAEYYDEVPEAIVKLVTDIVKEIIE